MRIVAGIAKGRKLVAPSEGTRPMTGRAKESIFSILSEHIPGASVLDLYAGSGSLGLEALSRGAASAEFVEVARRAVRALEGNIEGVGLGGDVFASTVERYLESEHGPFDLVFVDPPYAEDDPSVGEVLARLEAVLAPEGIVVVHRQARSTLMVPEFLRSRDERRYGDAVVTMLERSEP